MKRAPKISLLLLRIFIAWHFLYEGLIKLIQPEWSSISYLKGSYGLLSGFYHWLASDPNLVQLIDFMNIWGMLLLGAGLFLGVLTRVSAVSGILLLALYYFAYPPFGSAYNGSGADGHYWIINNNLIEIFALVIVYAYPIKEFSLMKFLPTLPRKKSVESEVPKENSGIIKGRREIIKGLATLPFFGGMIFGSVARAKSMGPDAFSGATIKVKEIDISNLKGEMPMGKLGNLEVSRLHMGGNLITGISHSRDLRYVRQLFKQYNTEERLFETFALAEQAGINMINIGVYGIKVFNRYKKAIGTKMETCVQAMIDMEGNDRLSIIKGVMETGASSIYVHGSSGDTLCHSGRMDLIQEAVEYIQSQGYPAGIGGHSVQVVTECEKAGLKPEYYFKSMHHDNYWSAHPLENRENNQMSKEMSPDHNHYHDNMWDVFPEQTVDAISKVKVPVIGFKVLAAGALNPEDGFRYAFENGADFICVGMFDYQVVDNVNLVTEILKNGNLQRSRSWYS